jgi:hypothetical protein
MQLPSSRKWRWGLTAAVIAFSWLSLVAMLKWLAGDVEVDSAGKSIGAIPGIFFCIGYYAGYLRDRKDMRAAASRIMSDSPMPMPTPSPPRAHNGVTRF